MSNVKTLEINMNVEAKIISGGYELNPPYVIRNYSYSLEELTILLVPESGGDALEIKITEVTGIKMLNEINFSAYWPTCASGRGALFLIEKNGWFDFEKTRSDFISGDTAEFNEYFIPSINECICILAWGVPALKIISST